MTSNLGPFSTTGTSTTFSQRRTRLGVRALAATATVGVLLGIAGVPAFAAPGDISSDTTIANVEVTTAIVLSGLTPTFTLTGIPGATVTGPGEVTMTVETNNLAGYAVTVQSSTDSLLPTDAGNADEIPIGALSVRETGTTPWQPMTAVGFGARVTTHTQAVRSAEGGDDLSNDYQVVIPFVNEDTYTATLNYVATTL